ncbi:MAG: acetyl-CoA acetyltransferase [Polyangiales bacterium]
MSEPTFVLGGFQTDFARHLAREGADLAALVGEAVAGALDDAGVDAGEVGVVHVGNAFGELFAGQAQLGAMPATAVPALWGVASSRHEAACASGGVALLAAMADLEAGRYDCALVVGVEQERNVPGEVAARHLGTAAWAGHEGEGARYLWPHMFSRVAEAYDARHGLKREHLVAFSLHAFARARLNPLAQTRGWRFDARSFEEDDALNPVVEGALRRQDCAQVTDGAAAVVLATGAFLRGRSHRRRRAARVAGWGHRAAGLGLDEKLRRAAGSEHLFPHLRAAVTDAYRRAGVADASKVDVFELHDCFSITGLTLVEHLGVTAPGEAWRAVEDGRLAKVNPGGGLIGGGHPVGATGVRMVLDAARQVTGAAGPTQVEGARVAATINLGGSATTAVAFVVAQEGLA